MFNQIQFMEADLLNEESLSKAIEGCHYIVHVASPITGAQGLTDEEMLLPARTGMKFILNAAVENKVERLVVTSAFFTMAAGYWKRHQGETNYSEEDFAPFEEGDGYAKSKISQE